MHYEKQIGMGNNAASGFVYMRTSTISPEGLNKYDMSEGSCKMLFWNRFH